MLIMTKRKHTLTSQNNITTVFGYSLFVLTVISFVLSTVVPLSLALAHPTARHFNIIVMITAFAIAAILPALASYLIGDRATHTKNKSLHHYNGILFGIAAYWVAQVLTWVGFSSFVFVSELPFPAPLAITNTMPVILAIMIMAIIAVTYAKKQKQTTSVLHYRPYQAVLITSIIGYVLYPIINIDVNSGFAASSLVFLLVPVIIVAIAYKCLARYHQQRLALLCDAIIAMSMGWIATWVADPLIASLQLPYQIAIIPTYVVGLVVYASYLYLRTRG